MNMLIVFCASYLIWFIVVAALVYLLFSKEWKRLGVFAALSLALAYAVGKVAGHLWYDPRPFVTDGTTPLIPHAANNGFPSDHMLMGATIASIIFIYNRTLGIILWVLALLVGLSRVAAGVHHYADLAGAILIAVVVVVAVEYALRRWWPRAGGGIV
jgi:undecaprenyl-diphosphatase